MSQVPGPGQGPGEPTPPDEMPTARFPSLSASSDESAVPLTFGPTVTFSDPARGLCQNNQQGTLRVTVNGTPVDDQSSFGYQNGALVVRLAGTYPENASTDQPPFGRSIPATDKVFEDVAVEVRGRLTKSPGQGRCGTASSTSATIPRPAGMPPSTTTTPRPSPHAVPRIDRQRPTGPPRRAGGWVNGHRVGRSVGPVSSSAGRRSPSMPSASPGSPRPRSGSAAPSFSLPGSARNHLHPAITPRAAVTRDSLYAGFQVLSFGRILLLSTRNSKLGWASGPTISGMLRARRPRADRSVRRLRVEG